jgi:two-component system response regulator YesN
MILEGLKMILPWSELNFEIVATANHAAEAIDYLTNHSIDLLITDITMPEMTGLEMVEKMQEIRADFETIILSGYQTFEYAKTGISLGVTNYLTKPVNRDELLASVESVKEKLDARKKAEEEQTKKKEFLFRSWLQDELNESEFQMLQGEYSFEYSGPYSVLEVFIEVSATEKVEQLLLKTQQEMYMTRTQDGLERFVIIFSGNNPEKNTFLHEVSQILADVHGYVVAGEKVEDWENVYESYEHVEAALKLVQFYPDMFQKQKIYRLDVLNNEEATLTDFNKALMSGNMEDIKRELSEIIHTIQKNQLKPSAVRQLSLLMLADLYRSFENVDEKNYHRLQYAIMQATNVNEVFESLEEFLALAQNEKEAMRYSENVRTLVERIHKDYVEELTLAEIAEEQHMNVVYLGSLFKKETGYSFAQYLNQERIKQAQKLLTETSMTVNEISYAVGYNNTNYFSKIFKKLNGKTPKEYRAR